MDREGLSARFRRIYPRGNGVRGWQLSGGRVEGEQERGGAWALEARLVFMSLIWKGHTITCMVTLAEWKNRNGMGPTHSPTKNREAKWRPWRWCWCWWWWWWWWSWWWWWLGFLWLMWLLQAASLIKVWILWSAQLSKLHMAAVRSLLVHLILVLSPCFISPVLGTDSWHRQGLAFLLITDFCGSSKDKFNFTHQLWAIDSITHQIWTKLLKWNDFKILSCKLSFFPCNTLTRLIWGLYLSLYIKPSLIYYIYVWYISNAKMNYIIKPNVCPSQTKTEA